MVPLWVALDDRVRSSGTALRIYVALISLGNVVERTSEATWQRVAEVVGLSRSCIYRDLTVLQGVRAIVARPDGSWWFPMDDPDESTHVENESTTVDDASTVVDRASLIDVKETSSNEEVVARPEIVALCEQLADRIRDHRATGSRPNVTTKWLRDMRLLVERGPADSEPSPISAERVGKGIDFVFTRMATPDGSSDFCWADVVRSPGGLRKHWEKILDAARRKQGGSVSKGRQAIDRARQPRGDDRGARPVVAASSRLNGHQRELLAASQGESE